jgi:hypothetical protein
MVPRADGNCNCDHGSLFNGTCPVSGCTSYSGAVGQSPCLTCDSTIYYAAPVAGTCVCVPANLVNGVCEAIYYGLNCTNLAFTYCSKCLSRGCLSCATGLESDSTGACNCAEGTLLLGVCNTIVGCIQPTVLPDGSKSCLACNTTYFIS